MEGERDANAAGPSGSLEAAWKQFGRDNPAGKALFKLYNKDAAKQIGNSYHTRNKQVHDKKLASGWTPPPVTVAWGFDWQALEPYIYVLTWCHSSGRWPSMVLHSSSGAFTDPGPRICVELITCVLVCYMVVGDVPGIAYGLGIAHLVGSPGLRNPCLKVFLAILFPCSVLHLMRRYILVIKEEPPKLKAEKPQVQVPKFPKRIEYETARINYISRRRPFEVIRQEIDAEYERMRASPQAPPNRPVLDDKEKARLAELMRFRGKVPAVTPEQLAAQCKAGEWQLRVDLGLKRSAPRKSEKEQLEEMFEEIVKEIEERREFLQALESAGRLRLDTVHMGAGRTTLDWHDFVSHSLSAASIFGKIRDALYFLFHPFQVKGKMDCWNRPICSAPNAWVDVMERRRAKDTTGVDFAQIVPTGGHTRCLNLSSYNYLGFAAFDPYCTPRVVTTIEELGISSCSSRIHAGTTSAHTELEELVAQYLGVEDAITYGMGFATNSSTIPALVGKGCLVMSDALNHSSIVAGIRASGAKVKVFRHNDADHLEKLLRLAIAEGQPRSHRPWKKVLVIVEGVYSMEGETCRLKEIVQVAKKYKAYTYLDEAHSIGALGPTGRGCCEHWGVDTRDVDIMMGTFTKSFGSCGGYIAGRREIIDYLRRHSPAHLYACSMAPGCVKQVTTALQVIMGLDGTDRGKRKIEQLHDNANYVRSRLLTMGMDVLGSWDSPVMPIMTYSAAKMVALSRMTLARNIAMVIVGFPATPVLLTRTRICISAAHTREDLDWALEQLEEVADLCMLRYRTKALYALVESELKDHVRRHFGPQLAERATIKALASGELDLRRSQLAIEKDGVGLKPASGQDAVGGHLQGGKQPQPQPQPAPSAKRQRTGTGGGGSGKVLEEDSPKNAGAVAAVTLSPRGTRGQRKPLANMQAHAKAFVRPEVVVTK
ncbi:hypothetical protein VOLCADRAFT_92508 [Volvox carteri f. nagariensis]|uniref:serine C-palmitoyltransferase n=1 Tax=Volvox carteri f. nagariensis TaxID=3068 RepID=D8TZU6_VOLCA|nr:uncharacterized protein VOLCADRAFT_92508 [Volvox carteri f. nagariensis]EFJ46984.1 hypothetical protein VOLCADRAFT_92508 [Volvox carteri f. nagariensis]|eukprot:XP_002951879.1 hypothetical protein VOLCADRAFT_92508 [Volvox carteri f. nagariensis]